MVMTQYKHSSPAVWLAILIGCAAWLMPLTAHASEPCNPPNVIPQSVCDMDSFYGESPRQLPVGWTAFVLSGDADFYQDDHTFFGGPNLTIRNSGGTFKLGIFTQVNVTPGTGYRASISWGAPNAPDLFGRQLGIDPTGGTDPLAPTVIWGPMHWGEGRILNYPPPDVNIDVKARALGDKVTVFFLTDHPQSSGDNLILVDAIALYPDDSAPAAEVLPPTTTPEPTATSAPVQDAAPAAPAEPAVAAAPAAPTETPTGVPSATPLPTETPTAVPTATPTPLPTATATPLPTATWTPWPTVTPESVLNLSTMPTRAIATARTFSGGLIVLSTLSFGGAAVFASMLWWLRRRK